MLTTPTQLATGLDIAPTLALLRARPHFGWLPGRTHDWGRMQMAVALQDPLLAPYWSYVESSRVIRAAVKVNFPGSVVAEHADAGRVALHVVLMTNGLSTFTCGNATWNPPAGSAWLIPIWQPHSARNAGTTPRIHLVVEMSA